MAATCRFGPILILMGLATTAPANDVRTVFPVISASGADPWVIRHDDGYYYMTASTNADITLWRSTSLTGIGGGEKKVIWTPPKSGPISKNLWAPEIHRLHGKWYIYLAADDGDNVNHRMYVLENLSRDPFAGEFVLKGKIADPKQDKWAIDGTVMTWNNRNYFIWSGWEGDKNVSQFLYIAPMSNPWTLSAPRVEISRPTLSWEKIGDPTVNEGPQVLIKNQSLYLIYSASGSWTDDYCLGRLTLTPGGDPLDPKAWVKHPEPVMRSTNGVYSPGHCSFTKSPDGKEDWLVYHAARHKGAGWARNIRVQRFHWNSDDTPRFDPPANPDRPVPLPSGEGGRQRLEAETAKRIGKATMEMREGASNRIAVTSFDATEDGIEFTVEAGQPGIYLLSIRHANSTAGKAKRTQRLTVNGAEPIILDYEYTAGNWAVVAIHRELKAGENIIRLTGKASGVAIDCLDVALTPKPQSLPNRVPR
jgi:GH43 family beta-xylosidase